MKFVLVTDQSSLPSKNLRSGGMEYTDVGENHVEINKYLLSSRKLKFRRTDQQQKIMAELLPEETIARIVDLKAKKEIKLADVYRLLMQRIISVDCYRKEFLLSQLRDFSFVRDLIRFSFPSKRRMSNK